MIKEKAFTIQLSEHEYVLTRANTDVYLHRPPEYQDLDFVRIFDFDTEVVTNVFRLPELARMLAGLAFNKNGFPVVPAFKGGDTFKDKYGWYADMYLRDVPSEETIAGFAMVEIDHDIDHQGRWELDGET